MQLRYIKDSKGKRLQYLHAWWTLDGHTRSEWRDVETYEEPKRDNPASLDDIPF